MVLMIVILLWLLSPIVSAFIAGRRGFTRPRWAFFILALGPLATLYILLGSPSELDQLYLERQRRPKKERRTLEGPTAEAIAAVALEVGSTVDGIRAQIKIEERGIKIRRSAGALNLITHGLVGEKSINYRSISAIQLRMPGELTSGYIQFSILGGVESRLGILDATRDENSVMFLDTQSAAMVALRAYIQARIESAHRPASAGGSVTDELAKLADLKDRGVITLEEFEAQKAKILRG